MKVALISFHSFYNPGGVKRHILALYKEFKKRGIEVKIIAPRRNFSENYGKDVILLGTSFPLSFGGSQSDFCVNFNPFTLDNTLRKEKFDILHFHNCGFPSSFQILERSNAVNILTLHANIQGSKFLKTFPAVIQFMKQVVNWKISGIIGVAPLCLKVFKNFKRPKTVIPNGVDLKEFNPRVPKINKFIEKDKKINILFVGRFDERKGLIYLLKAYKILEKKFSNLRLIILGRGEKKQEYQDWIKKNNLKEVYFEGEVVEERLPCYYATCDIFVSPAIFGESFGMVLLEAMACGKPVVGFANQGYKEFLMGKRGGFLVKNKNVADLVMKIETLIKNKDLREKMGKIALKEAKGYSWPKIADQVLDFYKLCVKKSL